MVQVVVPKAVEPTVVCLTVVATQVGITKLFEVTKKAAKRSNSSTLKSALLVEAVVYPVRSSL